MLKTSYRYEQTAARLVVEGFPDLSAGHSSDAIESCRPGACSWWGHRMEGTRDHLEALMAAVMPYARHRLSGSAALWPGEQFCEHRAGSAPICSNCAAAEKALNHYSSSSMTLNWPIWCAASQLRIDPRIKLTWTFPEDRPLQRREIVDRIPLQKRLGPPLLAGVALACSIATAWLVPLPEEIKESSPTAAPVDKPETQSDR